MSRLHLGGLICFGLAFLLYLASSIPGAILLGVLGAIFEVAGWIIVLTDRKPPDEQDSKEE